MPLAHFGELIGPMLEAHVLDWPWAISAIYPHGHWEVDAYLTSVDPLSFFLDPRMPGLPFYLSSVPITALRGLIAQCRTSRHVEELELNLRIAEFSAALLTRSTPVAITAAFLSPSSTGTCTYGHRSLTPSEIRAGCVLIAAALDAGGGIAPHTYGHLSPLMDDLVAARKRGPESSQSPGSPFQA
jgi:hypothetical protein